MSDPELAPLKVIEGYMLEEHTAAGWVLVESFDETQVEEHIGQEPQQMGDPSNTYGYNNGTVSTTRHFPATHRRFLVGFDKASTLAEQHEELRTLRETIATMNTNFEALEKEHHDLQSRQDALNERHQTLGDTYDRKCEEVDGLKKKLRAMEAAMGLVRTAIGDLQFKEIVGE